MIVRKVALVGGAATVRHAPWGDRTWDIWSHASSRGLCRRVDRFFDVHPKSIWNKPKRWDPNYRAWLKANRTPIYMQAVDRRRVPASVRYPVERIIAEFGPYFTSQAAWMIALALTEGVTHLGLFGIHYGLDEEYAWQRPGCEWMLGVAFGRGVNLVIPPGCPLLAEPPYLYGYESHTPERIRARRRWVRRRMRK